MATKTRASKTPAKTARKPLPKVRSKSAGKAPPAKKPAGKAAASRPAPVPGTEPQQRSLANVKGFFERTLSVLEEGDSGFAPKPEMFTVAQHVAHVAQTMDWFLEGAFRPEGFNMDFAGMEQQVRGTTSLAQAKAWLNRACTRLEAALKERPAAEWMQPIAKDTIMGGAPRCSIVDGIADHTAHHRGALAVYARLCGKTPAMPYM